MKQKKYNLLLFFSLFFSLIAINFIVPNFAFAQEQISGGPNCAARTGMGQIQTGSVCGCPLGQGALDDQGNVKQPPLGPDDKCQLTNPAPGQLISWDNFGELLKQIINLILIFAGTIAVIFIMIGGFRYVASSGNEELTEKAKKTITNAIIGVVLIVMAFAIVQIINSFLTKTPEENAPVNNNGSSSSGNNVNITTLSAQVIPGQLLFRQLSAANCPATQCRWQISGAPSWVSVSATGVLTGTAPSVSTAQDQALPFSVTATNTSTNKTQTQTFVLTLKAQSSGLLTP